MREELTRLGVQELRTAADVDAAVKNTPGTLMIIVNSICGCAAGKARPGVALALEHAVRPDRGRDGLRRRRHRGDRPRARLLHRLSALVAVNRSVARRQAGLDARAAADRKPGPAADCRDADARLRRVVRAAGASLINRIRVAARAAPVLAGAIRNRRDQMTQDQPRRRIFGWDCRHAGSGGAPDGGYATGRR